MSELDEENIKYLDKVELGIMIETPAAAIISDRLAPLVEFFSVGTNDLIQYTLACDRQNSHLERFCDTHHEAILRLIEFSAKTLTKTVRGLAFAAACRWKSHSYAASCSVSDRVLFQCLKDNPNIKNVFLCFDNDKAGQTANKRIADKLNSMNIQNEILILNHKDWNEDLIFEPKGVEQICHQVL